MLVIRRRPGETLVIGGDIEVEVLASTSSQVKLGIRAPREINVVRREILVVGEQNRVSAAGPGMGLGRLLQSLQQKGKGSSQKLPLKTDKGPEGNAGKGFPARQQGSA